MDSKLDLFTWDVAVEDLFAGFTEQGINTLDQKSVTNEAFAMFDPFALLNVGSGGWETANSSKRSSLSENPVDISAIQRGIADAKGKISPYSDEDIQIVASKAFQKDKGIYRWDINGKKYRVMVAEDGPWLLLTDTVFGEGDFKKAKYAISLSDGTRGVIYIKKRNSRINELNRLIEDQWLSHEEKIEQLKQIKADIFVQGIELNKRCDSPHIAKVFSYVENGAKIYAIGEYCNGGTLKSQFKHASEEQIILWMIDVVMGLSEINSKQITHRDIHPGNIMIHNGRAKIIDFDEAKDGGNWKSDYTQLKETLAMRSDKRWGDSPPPSMVKLLQAFEKGSESPEKLLEQLYPLSQIV